MDAGPERILVIDDDPGVARLLEELLRSEGYDVACAPDGRSGLDRALALDPHAILCDVMMPGLDGFDVCRILRSHPKTRYTCVILVTAKSNPADKVLGLRAGADDFVTKPFDPDELIERVRTALRRTRELAGLNPLTRLPGNDEIKRAIELQLDEQKPFALMHVDLDNFKAFNDCYGLLRGDAAIMALAGCLREVADQAAGMPFVGHTGGDDMVLIVDSEEAEPLAKRVLELWDERVRDLYDQEDLLRGHLETIDRNGRTRRYPIMAVSVGVATSDRRSFASHWQVSDIASRMKNVAKRRVGSSYEIDRREGDLRVTEIFTDGELNYPPVEDHTILVVDDNPMIREVLATYCGAKGFTVLEASDGIEAYQLAVKHRPAFVVLDFKMPHLNGQYTAELLREVAPAATIIALSAYLDAKPEWADAFIEKHQLHDLPSVLINLGSKATRPSEHEEHVTEQTD
ncbi:MAG TPA: response regulator [Actinomycetota bacterium]|nr:response regulator [Actinomycetota bacterium]